MPCAPKLANSDRSWTPCARDWGTISISEKRQSAQRERHYNGWRNSSCVRQGLRPNCKKLTARPRDSACSSLAIDSRPRWRTHRHLQGNLVAPAATMAEISDGSGEHRPHLGRHHRRRTCEGNQGRGLSDPTLHAMVQHQRLQRPCPQGVPSHARHHRERLLLAAQATRHHRGQCHRGRARLDSKDLLAVRFFRVPTTWMSSGVWPCNDSPSTPTGF